MEVGNRVEPRAVSAVLNSVVVEILVSVSVKAGGFGMAVPEGEMGTVVVNVIRTTSGFVDDRTSVATEACIDGSAEVIDPDDIKESSKVVWFCVGLQKNRNC